LVLHLTAGSPGGTQPPGGPTPEAPATAGASGPGDPARDQSERAQETEETQDAEDLRAGRRVLTAAVVAVLSALYVLQASLPHNAFPLPFQHAIYVKQFVPEGWAFFTRSPRTVYPVVYKPDADGRWSRWSTLSLATPSQAMGLNRSRRAEGTQVALILQDVPASAWTACSDVPATCLARTAQPAQPAQSVQPLTLTNDSTHRSICGLVGFVRQDVLPWAWRDSGTTMPSRVMVARVTC
jgi:antimicrobial peptide system SdpA family protein